MMQPISDVYFNLIYDSLEQEKNRKMFVQMTTSQGCVFPQDFLQMSKKEQTDVCQIMFRSLNQQAWENSQMTH